MTMMRAALAVAAALCSFAVARGAPGAVQGLQDMETGLAPGTMPEGFQECRLGGDCSVSRMPRDVTTMVYPGGATGCLDPDAPEYRFQVVPGDLDKVVIQFQGGGLCWSDQTFSLGVCTTKAMPDQKGIFERRKGNPFINFTIVNVLYCSGDFHAGNVSEPFGQQVGLENTRAVLHWTLINFPHVDTLVLSGSSAGSMAVQVYARKILTSYAGRFRSAVVLADSAAGVSPPGMEPTLMEQYLCQSPMVLDAGFGEQCDVGDLTIPEMYRDAMAAFPDVTFANLNSKTDLVQILYYDLWTDLESHDPNIDGTRYYAEVNRIFEAHNTMPNYISYQINGLHHVYLQLDAFFTTDPEGPGGNGLSASPVLVDWIAGLLGQTSRPAESVCHGAHYERSFWSRGLGGVLYCDSAQAGKQLRLLDPSTRLPSTTTTATTSGHAATAVTIAATTAAPRPNSTTTTSTSRSGSCTAADKRRMDELGYGNGRDSLGAKVYWCARGNLDWRLKMKEGAMNDCLRNEVGLSDGCASCFAHVNKEGNSHCRTACLGSWCSKTCQDCNQKYVSASWMEQCTGYALEQPPYCAR
jgi:hypothetical protein